VRVCVNPSCPFLARYGRRGEVTDRVARCPDCAAEVVPAGEVAPEPAPLTREQVARRPASRSLLLRLGVTCTCLSVVFVGDLLALPGAWTVSDDDFLLLPRDATWMAFGLTPFIISFGLVELIALLTPGLRRRRLLGRRARRPLRYVGLVLGLGLAALFAIVFAAWFVPWAEASGPLGLWDGADVVSPSRLWVIAALALGSVVSLAAAEVISRAGIGPGFVVVLGFACLVDSVRLAAEVARIAAVLGESTLVLSLVMELLVPGVLTLLILRPPWALARRSTAPLSLPAGGLAPMAELIAIGLGLTALVGWRLGWHVAFPAELTFHGFDSAPAFWVALVAASVTMGWLYNRPSRVAQVARALDPAAPPAGRAYVRATAIAVAASVGFVVALHLVWSVGEIPGASVGELALAPCLVAAGLDVADEWRFRRRHGSLSSAREVHRTYAVTPCLDALARAGIPAVARGRHFRALVPFLGTCFPIDILVPVSEQGRAAALLADGLGAYLRAPADLASAFD